MTTDSSEHTPHPLESPPPADLLADLAAALGVPKVTAEQGVFSHIFIVRHGNREFVLAAPYRRKPTRRGPEVWVIGEVEGRAYQPMYLHPRPGAKLLRVL